MTRYGRSLARSAKAGVWTFWRANSQHDPGELGLLGVERDFPGPKGLKNLAQGLPWVFGLMPKALKGRPLTRRRATYPEMPVAPSGLLTLGCVSQGKPWAKLSWPVGPKICTQALWKCPNSSPGTSCLAIIAPVRRWGSSAARGERAPPGSDGASPYLLLASVFFPSHPVLGLVE